MRLKKCYTDENGFLRADVEKGDELLAWFLEQDIQSSTESCKDMLGICNKVEMGKIPMWKGTGNAHTVTIKSENVKIKNEFLDIDFFLEIPLMDFKNALKEWLVFCSGVSSLKNTDAGNSAK